TSNATAGGTPTVTVTDTRSPSMAMLASRPFDVILERFELHGPERLDLLEPIAQRGEPLGPEPIDAHTRVVVLRRLDDPALAQHAEVAAHGRPARAERIRDVARAPRLAAEQIDHAPARRIGERDECLVEVGHCIFARPGSLFRFRFAEPL